MFAQHRAPRGKARVERAAAGDQAARLMRVQTGQQRRARRRAVVRSGEVVGEGDAAVADPVEVRHRVLERNRARPDRRAHLIDHDHEDVRRAGRRRAGGARRNRRCAARRRRRGRSTAGERRGEAAGAAKQRAGSERLLDEAAPIGCERVRRRPRGRLLRLAHGESFTKRAFAQRRLPVGALGSAAARGDDRGRLRRSVARARPRRASSARSGRRRSGGSFLQAGSTGR